MLIACICSRGLVHSRTMEAVLNNLKDLPIGETDVLFTHDLGIPDAQNDITERALAFAPTWVWYVEEDVVPAPGTLLAMLDANHPVVTTDYGLEDGSRSTKFSKHGTLLYGGMGCLLIRASILAGLRKPIFDCKQRTWNRETGDITLLGRDNHYGGQDIALYAALWQAGHRPHLCLGSIGHLRIPGLPRRAGNHGAFDVIAL